MIPTMYLYVLLGTKTADPSDFSNLPSGPLQPLYAVNTHGAPPVCTVAFSSPAYWSATLFY